MPYLHTRRVRSVAHIGHLDPADAAGRPSKDGPGIAVSVNPEDWRRIGGLNGPEHNLTFWGAQWVDILSWDANDHQELASWMLMRGYMKPCRVFHVSIYDEDQDSFIDHVEPDLERAARRAGRSAEAELEAQARGEGAVTEEDGYRLGPKALRRLGGAERWTDALDWFNGAALLYCREVVLPKRQHIVGMWWGQPREAEAKLSDYGVLFPERLGLFDVHDEETGESTPAIERFPDACAAGLIEAP
ncbi:hypothetical protein [Paracoccus sp. ME4]|uniref:hypothetical protein n=1 Tax=Paracoccus sp. ME4 TaxID=3138066 RepID=UPI00398B75A0